ncbi:MAG: type 1 glutamine amidotransferase [Proteobacteria bacterium]|nr:type 1 glutamine amidotransferase [Pseudomonadota bacterium]
MKPLLILDCYLDPQGGARNFVPVLQAVTTQVWRPGRDRFAPDPDSVCGLVITGSAASVIVEVPDWVEPVLQVVRSCADRELPILGVCFGQQVIARAFLGPDAVGPARTPEVGFFDIDVIGEDPLLAGLGPSFRVFVSHLEEVRPDGLKVLARTETCANHAFRLGDRPIWGVQFHAEMSREEARQTTYSKAEAHPELGLDPARVIATAVDTQGIFRRIVENFLAYL